MVSGTPQELWPRNIVKELRKNEWTGVLFRDRFSETLGTPLYGAEFLASRRSWKTGSGRGRTRSWRCGPKRGQHTAANDVSLMDKPERMRYILRRPMA